MVLKKERENGIVKEKCSLGVLATRELKRWLASRECFCLLGSENCNTRPGVVSKTGSNGVFEKKDPPMELMEGKEKTEENGAEPDRREVKVSWILK